MGCWTEGGANTWSQIQFILWNSSRRRETKVLKEGGEEEEEFHPGQTLSQTNPATCERRQKKMFILTASKQISRSDG